MKALRDRERGIAGNYTVWTVVGVLLIVVLVIYLVRTF